MKRTTLGLDEEAGVANTETGDALAGNVEKGKNNRRRGRKYRYKLRKLKVYGESGKQGQMSYVGRGDARTGATLRRDDRQHKDGYMSE